jgi:hypothetical protein
MSGSSSASRSDGVFGSSLSTSASEPFAAGIELAAEQFLQVVLQLLDLSLRMPNRVGLLADQFVAERHGINCCQNCSRLMRRSAVFRIATLLVDGRLEPNDFSLPGRTRFGLCNGYSMTGKALAGKLLDSLEIDLACAEQWN